MIASFDRQQEWNATFFGRRPHYNATYFGQRLHYIIPYFGPHPHYNAQLFGWRHMAHYNVNAGQKVAQRMKYNCNSLEILKVI